MAMPGKKRMASAPADADKTSPKHKPASPLPSITVATWNILADGLSLGEFMSNGGDKNVYWINRRDKIVSCLADLFQSGGCSVVATEENDHPFWILHQLQESNPTIRMCYRKKGTNASRFYFQRLSDELVATGAIDGPNKGGSGNHQKANPLGDGHHYDKVNAFLKKNPSVRTEWMNRGLTCTTNSDEHCPPTAESPSNQPDDLYVFADCLAVFYDSSQITLLSEKDHEDGVFQINFSTKPEGGEAGTPFTVFPAHLKSGVSRKDEDKRVRELGNILQHAQKSERPIVLMDSNTCSQYEQIISGEDKDKKGRFVSQVIDEHSFQNVVDEKGGRHENLKMRHAKGGQPKKFGEFMFDTIDKILLPRDGMRYEAKDHTSSCFTCYPAKHHQLLGEIRCDPKLRDAVRQMCIQGLWGPDMNLNSTNGITQFYKDNKAANTAFECPSPQDLKQVLLELYPNQHAPSDHPPCCATIQFLPTQSNGYWLRKLVRRVSSRFLGSPTKTATTN